MVRLLASASALGLALGLMAAPAVAQYSYSPASAATTVEGLSPVYSVRNVQEALNRLGYDSGAPDGVIGPRTRAAIRQYQAAQDLPVTGEPSAALYDRLLASVAGGAPAPAQAGYGYGAQAPSTVVTAIQSELRQRGYDIDAVTGEMDAGTRQAIMQYQTDAGLVVTGQASESLLSHMRTASVQRSVDRRQIVRELQEELNRRGYDAGPADGALGPKTQAAIRTYQSDAGLPITGEPSETLLASLRGGGTVAARRDRDDRFDGADADEGLVRDIQVELQRRGLYDGRVNGNLNRRTREAIRSYQSAMRLPETGLPSVDLLASLRLSDRGGSVAGFGSGDRVADIERALARRGYEVGRIDGVPDADTRAAIRAYQRDAGLLVDGEPSGDLLAHIERHDIRAGGWNGGRDYGNYSPRTVFDRFFQDLAENR